MSKIIKFIGYFTLTVIIFVASVCQADQPKLSSYPAIHDFIHQMVVKYHFESGYLKHIFNNAKLLPSVVSQIKSPYEQKPWYLYHNRLVNAARIKGGVKYWRRHAAALNYAEEKYGVPAYIVVAIVGVESQYGEVTLKYPVIDSLFALSWNNICC
jgi:membrane-bound lytic murein transglycosylase B